MSRRKINERPSGEIAGSASRTWPSGYVNCRFSPVSRAITNTASDFPSPGESVTTTHAGVGTPRQRDRAENAVRGSNVRHLTFGASQRRHQPHFTPASGRLAAEKRNRAPVRRPARAVVVARVGRQPKRSAGADLLNVDIGVVLLRTRPAEDHIVAIGRQRWRAHDSRQRRQRNGAQRLACGLCATTARRNTPPPTKTAPARPDGPSSREREGTRPEPGSAPCRSTRNRDPRAPLSDPPSSDSAAPDPFAGNAESFFPRRAERVAAKRLGGAGSSLRIFDSTDRRDSPLKAFRPVTIS